MRSVSLSSLVFVVCASVASAQGTTVNAVRGRISERVVIGSTTLGDVLRIVGASTVSSGTGTMNPAAVDSDGDVLEDSNTTVSTAGAWTWGGAGSFTSTLGVTGNVTGNTGTLLIGSDTRLTNTSPAFFLHDSDAASSEKYTGLEADGGLLALKLYDDTPSSANVLFQVDRTGLVPDDWRWGSLLATIRPESNGGSSLGSLTKKYLTLHAWELWVDTIVARNTIATIGGRIFVAPTTKLVRDLASSDTCISVEHNQARTNDTVLLQKNGKFEKILIGTNAIDCSVSGNCAVQFTGYNYCSLTRNRDGTGANDWSAGDAVLNEGNVGDGYIDIFSERSATSEGYPGQVVSAGPVAYFRMHETTSTTTADVMGNVGVATETGTQSNGLGVLSTLLGTASADPVWQNTDAGGYLLVADDTDLRITDDLTIEMWVYWEAGGGADNLLSRGGTSEYHIQVNADGSMTFCQGNGSTSECESTAASFVPTNTYTHLAIVRDATSSPKRVLFYKNGAFVSSSTYTQTVTAQALSTGIGANPVSAGNEWDGNIDEVAIYNYQVPADRLLLHYEARLNDSISKFTIGPTLCGNVRTGTGAFDLAERWCLGNLAGTYGYNSTTPVYGQVSGSYAGDWVSVDATNGYRNMYQDTVKLQAVGGNFSLTGDLTIGTSGSFRSGATAYDTGTGYWLDYNGGSPRFRIGTTTGAGTPSYLRWTGSALELVSERFSISSSGVSINTAGGLGCASTLGGYYFGFGDASTNGVYACESSGVRDVTLVAQKSGQAIVEINAINTDLSSTANLQIQADIGSTPAFLKINVDDVFINNVQGFSGTKTAGSCTFTIADGFITNVTGC